MNSSSPSLILYGANHVDNFGDTLFIRLFIDWVHQFNPEIRIGIPYACKKVQKYFPEIDESITLKNCNGIIFIGGGYLSPPQTPLKNLKWCFSFRKMHLPIIKSALQRKTPFCCIGIAINNYIDPLISKTIKQFLKQSKFVTVRDMASIFYAKKVGLNHVIKTADSVINMLSPEINETTHPILENKTIGIHLNISTKLSKAETMLLSWLSQLFSRDNFRAVVVLDHPANPRQFRTLEQIKQRIPNCQTIQYDEPLTFIKAISNLQVLITNKLHSGIIGILHGVQVISFPTHQKTIDFYKETGNGDFCYSIHNLNHQQFARIEVLIDSKRRPILNQKIFQLAQRNHTTLISFLSQYIGPKVVK